MRTLSIVIPAYNEEESIDMVLSRVEQVVPQFQKLQTNVEIIVVDDGSTDNTVEIVQRHRVRIVRHPVNQGYGAALKTGFRASQGEYIAFLDADGTYPPEYLLQLYEHLISGDFDIVVGSRMIRKDTKMPFIRKIGNRLFAWLLRWLAEEHVSDSASGMRVFKKAVLHKLEPLPNGLDLTPAMSTRAILEGVKISELPIPYHERVGKSKLSPVIDGFRFLGTMVSIARLYNPLKFLGLIGFIFLLLAFALGVPPIAYYIVHRRVEDWEIYRLLTIVVLSVTGFNCIILGMFANFVFAILHGRTLQARSLLSRLMMMSWRIGDFVGTALMLVAILLNHRTILQYLSTGHITVHWVYGLTGAFLFLVGGQLAIISFLKKSLDALIAHFLQRGIR